MPPTLIAVRAKGVWRPGPRRGVVTYRVLAEGPPRPAAERRDAARARARLRSGKLLDMAFAFLTHCRVHDRSSAGARLRVDVAAPLPRDLHFYDDETTSLRRATIVWRRDDEIGLRLLATRPARDLTRAERAALAGRYYAAR